MVVYIYIADITNTDREWSAVMWCYVMWWLMEWMKRSDLSISDNTQGYLSNRVTLFIISYSIHIVSIYSSYITTNMYYLTIWCIWIISIFTLDDLLNKYMNSIINIHTMSLLLVTMTYTVHIHDPRINRMLDMMYMYNRPYKWIAYSMTVSVMNDKR